MGGGLMQLVAYGAQDVYLTGNPQITFWKVTYRRHTNFAMESIEQTFNGQADFGRRVTCTLARNGDLAYRTYLQVTLPEIGQTQAEYARWLDFPGEQMIAQVEVEVGGQRIDRQYGDWMHIWNQLTLSKEQERGYNKMVGNTTQLTYITDPEFANVDGPCDSNAPRQVCAPRNALPETTLYVPFQFWYCRNPGLALPLIALQYHEVRINLDIRPIDECLWAVSSLGTSSGSSAKSTQGAYSQSLVAASLYVDYVFLDTDERRRMAQNPHEYLIEQLQFTGDESVGSSSNKIKLNFNHPVKELVWVVQPDQNVDYCSRLRAAYPSFQGTSVLSRSTTLMPLMLFPTRSMPSVVRTMPRLDTSLDNTLLTSVLLVSSLMPVPLMPLAHLPGPLPLLLPARMVSRTPLPMVLGHNGPVSDAGSFVLAETALNMHCWGENPVVTAKLSLTARTASLSVRVPTSTLCSLTSTTPATRTLVSMYTPSRFALRSTSHPAAATSRALITRPFSLSSPTLPLRVPRLPRSVSMPLTTTSSALCRVWEVSPTPTKLVNKISNISFNHSLII